MDKFNSSASNTESHVPPFLDSMELFGFSLQVSNVTTILESYFKVLRGGITESALKGCCYLNSYTKVHYN